MRLTIVELKNCFDTPFVNFSCLANVNKKWNDVRDYLNIIIEANIDFKLLYKKIKKQWKNKHDKELKEILEDDDRFVITDCYYIGFDPVYNIHFTQNIYITQQMMVDDVINEYIGIVKEIITKNNNHGI